MVVPPEPKRDESLAIVQAHRWRRRIESGKRSRSQTWLSRRA
jgi:hypothetical protein